MDVLENIKQAVSLLKEVEEYDNQLNGGDGLISTCDKKIDYWEHYLEFQPLKVTEVYNICREMKKQRALRRMYKNDAYLIKVFKDNEAKMQNSRNREMLMMELFKTDGKQKNAKYYYDAYTDEERDIILGRKPKIATETCPLMERKKEELL